MSNFNERIVPLDELDDLEVAEGDPDVRGWNVYGADGSKIGEVDELLVDTATLKVRYLDVDLDEPVTDAQPRDRHVLIPIGYARLAESDDHILIDALDGATLSSLPTYAQEPLTRDFELTLLQRFNPAAPAPAPHTDQYVGDVYDDGRFYGARRRSPT